MGWGIGPYKKYSDSFSNNIKMRSENWPWLQRRSKMDNQPPTAGDVSVPAKFSRLRCIVKFGGAAITYKHEFERVNEDNLNSVSSQLRQAMGIDHDHVMDWSRQPGSLEIPSIADYPDDQLEPESKPFVIVHGAGSFGHFQASKSGVHKGGLERSLVMSGFVATRISVTSLNLEVVRALAKRMRVFLPLGSLPFHVAGLLVKELSSADTSILAKAIDKGFVPVLHGDAVLDSSLGCTILSGDVIIRQLADQLRPEYVVFLTDVLGVYNLPPVDPGAVLLREIAVKEDGSWYVLDPKIQETEVEISVAAHDTTGGMITKLSEAAMIAKLGIDVYIVKAATDHSLVALRGGLKQHIPHDWLGTVVRLAK